MNATFASKALVHYWYVTYKAVRCLASVLQNGEMYTRGAQPHTCPVKESALHTVTIKAQLKKEGKARPFASGSTLVKEALQQHLPPEAPTTSLPSMSALVRSTNYQRQNRRPKHPTDVNFQWVEEALPSGFVKEDMNVGTARHVILFTTMLFTLLSNAKTWYVDATFKAVKRPFYQLWSIHAFIQQKDTMKQVPLLFVLMSRRMKDNYINILEYLKRKLTRISVQCVVMDFEQAVWGAFRSVFPSINLRGCSFHWGQTVWRKIQDVGLAPAYRERRNTHKYLRELLCLLFLPHQHIQPLFKDFQDLITPDHPEALHEFLAYLENTWIQGHVWTPADWSIFGQSIRTNNDTEGWHHRLNQLCVRLGNNVNVYELIEVLHQECNFVSTQCQLVCDDKLRRYQRKTYQKHQKQIFDLWDDYKNKLITSRELLSKISIIHRPAELRD